MKGYNVKFQRDDTYNKMRMIAIMRGVPLNKLIGSICGQFVEEWEEKNGEIVIRENA